MPEENNAQVLTRQDILEEMNKVLNWLKIDKPQDRSGDARYYAVVITEMEKVIAYYQIYLTTSEDSGDSL